MTPKEKVQSYIDGVTSGAIVACKLVRLAVQRHLKDLERSAADPEWPYYFDEAAWRRLRCS